MNILFLLLQFTDVYFNLDCCIYFNQLYLLQLTLNLDIEAQIREIQSRKKEVLANGDEGNKSERIGLGESGYFDRSPWRSPLHFDIAGLANAQLRHCEREWLQSEQILWTKFKTRKLLGK